MNFEAIIGTRFAEPAVILSYRNDEVRIVEINKRYIPELWMNVSREDFIEAFPKKTFDENNMRVFVNAVRKCVDTGEEQSVETWRKVFSNCCGFDNVCLKSRLILIEKSDEGAIVYESIRNISNEKRTQDTLADIEYRYKQASEQINIYNWEYDIATKEMRPCYRCMRDLGLPALVRNYPEPAIDAGIFPPDYADMYRDMMRRVDAGEDNVEADIPLTVGRIPFRVKYSIEKDAQGRPVKAFGSATLISETELGTIKLDNQIIASLAEGYACIYLADFAKDSVKPVKCDDEDSLKNGVGCAVLAETLSSKLKDISKERREQIGDVDTLRGKLFQNGDRREFVYKDDQENQWIRIDLHVIERGEGGIVNRLLITRSVIDDLRAQKMDADRLIASQKEELEDRQKMLLEAIEAANKANKAKTEFFSNMSHDIRTPMNAITGFSKLALDEINDKERLEDYLCKISVAGDHLMSLINDILDMSRIESGKMELSQTPVKLKELLLECADMIRVKMDDNKLRFFVNVENMGEDVVECDKLRFNQVMLNLLSNAYKYTPEGGSVYLEGRLVERKDTLKYEIRVRDTGIGMSASFRERIWDAFAREETEIVHETQGTGLGMVIVRNIVNLMQGTIDLESEPGKGSEFIILLPLKPAEEAMEKPAAERAVEDALKRDYSGKTLLVVDDTDINLVLAGRVLSKFGFRIKLSDSGVDALQQIKDAKPGEIDMILMDVMMPVMDGLETTKRIRALEDPGVSDVPIIAMTANAFESDVKDAYDAGMDDYISKPYKKEDLIAVINANLR